MRSLPFLLVFLAGLPLACIPAADPGDGEAPGASARGGVPPSAQTGGRAGSGGAVMTGGTAVEPAGTGGMIGATGGRDGSGGAVVADSAAPVPDVGSHDAGGPADSAGPPPTGSVASPACAMGAKVPGPDGTQTIKQGERNRTFIIRLPSGYDGKRPFPILLAFHGAGGGAPSFESGAFAAISRMVAPKAIRIFPQAFAGNTWARDEPDDVKYIDLLFEWLKTNICYDEAKVFSSGQSSGAYFSHRLACDRGDLIRGIATNSGGKRREAPLDCAKPVSAWISGGKGDSAGHVMAAQQARDVWVKRAECSMTTMPTTPSPCVAYQGCRPGYKVHFCLHDGGHPLPGYAPSGIHNFLFGE